MRLKLSARKSDLAKLQAFVVAEALQKQNPQVQVEFLFRESLGDKNLEDPLWKIPQKGVFTEDFYMDLVQGKTDFVVHSWKDLATEEKPDTFIIATLPRADARDLLLVKKSHFDIIRSSKRLRIFTSSPRRFFHLPTFCKSYLPFSIEHCEFDSVRGNIPTRLQKLLENPNIDALVMAKAALDRLLHTPFPELQETRNFLREELQKVEWTALPLSLSPPAPAQGALAIEIRRDRKDLIELFSSVNDPKTFFEAQKEREILQKYGGGCHQKIGVISKRLPHGDFLLSSGEHQGAEFFVREFHTGRAENKFSSHQVHCAESFDQFQAHPLSPPKMDSVSALEITKSEHYKGDFSGILWTSGLETWKKLSKRGFWVHGSQESFGEDSDLRPSHDFTGAKIRWGKLTHLKKIQYKKDQYQKDFDQKNQGQEKQEGILNLPAYELVEKGKFPDLSPYECFFWKSYSLFEKAVTEQPQILKKTHCCGLGQTAVFIEKHLQAQGISQNVLIFLDESDWRKSYVHSTI